MNEGPERIDYRETSDVTEVHAAIKREHRDPSADVTPIPLWLTAVCGVAVCWAGAYIGVFNGGFSSKIYNEYESSPSALFPIPEKKGTKPEVRAELSLAQQGKAVYAQCATCHQGTGLGLPGVYPPLVKSEYVVGGEKRLLAILLKGIQGAIVVEGKTYLGAMPSWEKSLNDKKIAAVASYIRSEWGNSAPEIAEAKVAMARKEFEAQTASWIEAQLLQIPADANFSGPASAPSAAPVTKPAAATAVPVVATGAVDPAVMDAGKQAYMSICVACHQPNGLGLAPLFPPLAKSDYATGDPKRLVAIILKGVAGAITVEGKPYNGMMPGQEAVLTDAKIAAVATYVRNSFQNSASPVAADFVSSVRKEYADRKTGWSEAELQSFGGSAAGAAPASVESQPVSAPAPVPVEAAK